MKQSSLNGGISAVDMYWWEVDVLIIGRGVSNRQVKLDVFSESAEGAVFRASSVASEVGVVVGMSRCGAVADFWRHHELMEDLRGSAA